MKKFLLFLAAVLAFTSCSNDLDNETTDTDTSVTVPSMSSSEFNQLNEQLESLFASMGSINVTRGSAQQINNAKDLEVKAKAILQPLALEGKSLVNYYISQANVKNSYKLSTQEITNLKNLDDGDLAYLAYIVEFANNNPKIIENNRSAFMNCAMSAAGIGEMKDFLVGIGGIVRGNMMLNGIETIGWRFAIGFGTKYLGYVGAAVALYKFAKCLRDVKGAADCNGLAHITGDLADFGGDDLATPLLRKDPTGATECDLSLLIDINP